MTEWGKLTFKVVRIETAGQELLALAGNFIVARAALTFSTSGCSPPPKRTFDLRIGTAAGPLRATSSALAIHVASLGSLQLIRSMTASFAAIRAARSASFSATPRVDHWSSDFVANDRFTPDSDRTLLDVSKVLKRRHMHRSKGPLLFDHLVGERQ
jgi:hypothetical protein